MYTIVTNKKYLDLFLYFNVFILLGFIFRYFEWAFLSLQRTLLTSPHTLTAFSHWRFLGGNFRCFADWFVGLLGHLGLTANLTHGFGVLLTIQFGLLILRLAFSNWTLSIAFDYRVLIRVIMGLKLLVIIVFVDGFIIRYHIHIQCRLYFTFIIIESVVLHIWFVLNTFDFWQSNIVIPNLSTLFIFGWFLYFNFQFLFDLW